MLASSSRWCHGVYDFKRVIYFCYDSVINFVYIIAEMAGSVMIYFCYDSVINFVYNCREGGIC